MPSISAWSSCSASFSSLFCWNGTQFAGSGGGTLAASASACALAAAANAGPAAAANAKAASDVSLFVFSSGVSICSRLRIEDHAFLSASSLFRAIDPARPPRDSLTNQGRLRHPLSLPLRRPVQHDPAGARRRKVAQGLFPWPRVLAVNFLPNLARCLHA